MKPVKYFPHCAGQGGIATSCYILTTYLKKEIRWSCLVSGILKIIDEKQWKNKDRKKGKGVTEEL